MKSEFIKNLYRIGYAKNNVITKTKYEKQLTVAFQRRFRQMMVNGKIDLECFIISKKIAK